MMNCTLNGLRFASNVNHYIFYSRDNKWLGYKKSIIFTLIGGECKPRMLPLYDKTGLQALHIGTLQLGQPSPSLLANCKGVPCSHHQYITVLR